MKRSSWTPRQSVKQAHIAKPCPQCSQGKLYQEFIEGEGIFYTCSEESCEAKLSLADWVSL